MLRMAGIPARVAAGFSPGSYNRDTASTACATSTPTRGSRSGSQGIGWVPFDPTPARSPAQSQSSALRHERRGRRRAARCARRARAWRPRSAARTPARGLGSDGGNGWLAPRARCCSLAAPLAARRAGARASACAACARLGPDELAEVQLAELRRALVRLGLGPARRPPRCSGSSAGSAASPGPPRRPTRGACAGTATTRARRPRPAWAERRALRRELSRGQRRSTGCAA